MARTPKTHGHVHGDPWTICGLLRRGRIVSLARPIASREVGKWESLVTCENCWKSFP